MSYIYKADSLAKVNLFLHVIGKNDNYHNLESLVVFTPNINDTITVEDSSKLELEITGDFKNILEIEDNIILKAANLIKGEKNLGAKILLDKNIPIKAGIGGGSSNAATTIKLLNKLWDIDSKCDLSLLGADVPSCYYGNTTYFSGIGEILEPVKNFPNIYLVLVKPEASIITKDIFHNLDINYSEPLVNKPLKFKNIIDLVEFLKLTRNDLQHTAIQFVPEIEDILAILANQNGCLISRMSGSGSTCFGLFATEKEAKAAYLNIIAKFTWWANYSMIK